MFKLGATVVAPNTFGQRVRAVVVGRAFGTDRYDLRLLDSNDNELLLGVCGCAIEEEDVAENDNG